MTLAKLIKIRVTIYDFKHFWFSRPIKSRQLFKRSRKKITFKRSTLIFQDQRRLFIKNQGTFIDITKIKLTFYQPRYNFYFSRTLNFYWHPFFAQALYVTLADQKNQPLLYKNTPTPPYTPTHSPLLQNSLTNSLTENVYKYIYIPLKIKKVTE